MNKTITGWLFDVYPNDTNLTIWILGEDGQRYRLFQDFSASIYAAGPFPRLRELWKWLKAQPISVRLTREERKDVFQGLVTVLAVEVLQPARLYELFRDIVAAFPNLIYYDADISLSLRYAAAFNVFPLARCRVEVREEKVISITPLDTPWELEPEPAPLRILSLEPNCDPAHGEPEAVTISYGHVRFSLPLEKKRPLLICLAAELKRYDPDVILTSWGDTWLMPFLMEACKENGISLPLNRDDRRKWWNGKSIPISHTARSSTAAGSYICEGAGIWIVTMPCFGATTGWMVSWKWRVSPASRLRRPPVYHQEPGSRPCSSLPLSRIGYSSLGTSIRQRPPRLPWLCYSPTWAE